MILHHESTFNFLHNKSKTINYLETNIVNLIQSNVVWCNSHRYMFKSYLSRVNTKFIFLHATKFIFFASCKNLQTLIAAQKFANISAIYGIIYFLLKKKPSQTWNSSALLMAVVAHIIDEAALSELVSLMQNMHCKLYMGPRPGVVY